MAFVSDTFTDSDGTTLTTHTGEVGASWSLHPNFNGRTFEILGNQAKIATGGSGTYGAVYASGAPSSAEYDVEVKFVRKNASDSPNYVLGRLDVSASTYYSLGFDTWSGDRYPKLRKVVSGATTLLATAASPIPSWVGSESYQFKLEIRDAAKKGYVDGVEVVSSADNAITPAGKSGLMANQYSNIYFDDFTATDAGSGNIGEALSFAVSAGVAPSSIAAAQAAVTLSVTAAVADQRQATAIGALPLPVATAVAFAGAASAIDSLAIGLAAGCAFGRSAAAQGLVSLSLHHSTALSSVTATIAALAFGIGHGVTFTVTSTGDVDELIALSLVSGLVVTSVAAAGGSLTFGFEVALGFLTGEQISEAISLGLVSGVSVAAQVQSIASITVNIAAATAAAAQASALGAITLGQDIGAAIALVLSGGPPSGVRTIAVPHQGRNIIVTAKTRIIEV